MSGYRAFAPFYDALTADVDYPARAAYFLSLFERFGRAPRTLLDVACGSGSLTREFVRRGIEVIGVDASCDMLSLAQQKTAGLRPPVLLLEQDMRALQIGRRVEGAVCALDSLSHLCRTADVLSALRGVRRALLPGGVFLFDVNTPYKHREILRDNDFIFEQDGLICLWRNRLHARTCEVDMQLDFLAEDPDGRYERYEDEVRERAYTARTWQALLREAGFALLAHYGDMTTDPPGETCERWVFAARAEDEE